MALLYNLTPTIHRVEYSIHIPSDSTFRNLINDLVPIFGEYTINGDINHKENGEGTINYYDSKTWISIPNAFNYRWAKLSFFPEAIDIFDLISILKNNPDITFPKVESDDPKAFQNLPTIEVKFDFHIKRWEQDEHQKLAEYLAKYLFPLIPYRNYYFKIEGENKEDEYYINGDCTHYWFSPQLNNILKGYYPRRSEKASFCKVYVKFSKEEKIWFIRFESTLRVYQLKHILGHDDKYKFDLPFEFPCILYSLREKSFKDFYAFARVKYDKAIEDIKNTKRFKIAEKYFDNMDFNKLIELEKEERFSKTSFKNYLLSNIINRLNLKKLRNNKRKNYLEFAEEKKIIQGINKKFNIDLKNVLVPLNDMV